MPLWRGEPDNIIGVLHAKDLLRAYVAAGGDASKFNIADLTLEPWFIPESTTLRDQLQAFLSRKMHSALVVDEYGVVQGLITLEDIIEEIVGDIRDEKDREAPIQSIGDGRVVADASVSIAELEHALGKALPDDGEFESLGGLIVSRAGRVPKVGATMQIGGLKLIGASVSAATSTLVVTGPVTGATSWPDTAVVLGAGVAAPPPPPREAALGAVSP